LRLVLVDERCGLNAKIFDHPNLLVLNLSVNGYLVCRKELANSDRFEWSKLFGGPDAGLIAAFEPILTSFKDNEKQEFQSTLARLNQWVRVPNATGDRAGAVAKMIDASVHQEKSLNLTRFGLDTLPNEIEQFQTLRKLIITNKDFHELPPTIGHLTELQHLDLSNDSEVIPFQKKQPLVLPKEICQLTSLRALKLSGNSELELSEEMFRGLCQLPLHTLEISGTKIDQGVGRSILEAGLANLFLLMIGKWQLNKKDGDDRGVKAVADQLTAWVLDSSAKGDRGGAAAAIFKAYLYEKPILDLTQFGLSTLPDAVGELVNLKELYINNAMCDFFE
jgi:Leucine-rich repeat (LRR) protein